MCLLECIFFFLKKTAFISKLVEFQTHKIYHEIEKTIG